MITSGVEALDRRLGGGLLQGRYYLLGGSPGAGKTTACIQFLAAGLEAGETCLILTQENPSDLLAQAEYIGCDFRAYGEREQLIVLQYRLDFAHNYARVANPEAVADELVRLVGDAHPTRLVADTVLPLTEAGGGRHGAVHALLNVLERYSPTAYFTVPGDISDSYFARIYDTVVTGSAGIFHFELRPDRTRELVIRKSRQAGEDDGPLSFTMRAGHGIVPLSVAMPEAEQDTAQSESVERSSQIVVFDSERRLTEDLLAGLRQSYDVRVLRSDAEVRETSSENIGVLLLALTKENPESAFGLVRALRAAGCRAPIIYITRGDGLRGATRARGLRAGGDDFIGEDLTPGEFLAHVEAARQRGHHLAFQAAQNEVLLLQPRDEEDVPEPIEESELGRAVSEYLDAGDHPFFALVDVDAGSAAAATLWHALVAGVRLGDGDLIARRHDGSCMLYLHDISRRRVRELLERIAAANPEVDLRIRSVYHYPVDAREVNAWLQHQRDPVRAAG